MPVYAKSYGFTITLDTNMDIATVTEVKATFTRPDQTKFERTLSAGDLTILDPADGTLTYQARAGDLYCAGVYEAVCCLTYPSSGFGTARVYFTVHQAC